MDKKLIQEPGKCPVCGSERLEYGSHRYDDYGIGYPYTCSDCNTSAIEWFDLKYNVTLIQERSATNVEVQNKV